MSSKKTPPVPSAALGRYLSQRPEAAPTGPSAYIMHGVTQVSDADLAGLETLLPRVAQKAAGITSSDLLRRRLDLLMTFFRETSGLAPTPARRETAFVLFYFLKGYDLIPDGVPEVGLLDDALLVENVLNRNQSEFRAHWMARQRAWPAL